MAHQLKCNLNIRHQELMEKKKKKRYIHLPLSNFYRLQKNASFPNNKLANPLFSSSQEAQFKSQTGLPPPRRTTPQTLPSTSTVVIDAPKFTDKLVIEHRSVSPVKNPNFSITGTTVSTANGATEFKRSVEVQKSLIEDALAQLTMEEEPTTELKYWTNSK